MLKAPHFFWIYEMSENVSALDQKSKYFFGKILVRSLIYAFALFGVLLILLLLALIGLIGQDTSVVADVPSKAVLTVNFDDVYDESSRSDLFSEFSGGAGMSFHDLVTVLETAAVDPRVQALAGRVHISGLGMAQLEELRTAVAAFRSRGKPAYIFAPGFGSFGGGTGEYYLATAFDEITMLPNSDLGATGVYAEIPFFKNILDKVGAKAEFFTRYEYKNAMVSLTDGTAPAPLTRSVRGLTENLNQVFGDSMVAARYPDGDGLSAAEIRRLSPMSAKTAKDKGLIDNIGFEGDWLAAIKERHNAETADAGTYLRNIRFYQKAPYVALVVVDGLISDGYSFTSPTGEAVVGVQSVLAQIDELRENNDLKAVVLRLNSPGGSYAASSEILHALNRLKADKKIPLIVSMGNYAASGGYFIALAGDKIFADAATLTGSIGVLGGKVSIAGLWQKLGVNWLVAGAAENAGVNSVNRPFTKEQKELINKSLDAIYEDFTLKVSQARNIDLKKLDKLARGRVMTGKTAVETGLADEIGGVSAALTYALQAAGINPGDKYGLLVYPRPKTLQEKLSEMLSGVPVVRSQQIKAQLGLDISALNMLKRLQYDAVMLPLAFKY